VIVIPAVDLRDGKCVQLVGGEYDQESVRLDDPPAVARDWIRHGFTRLHVVDLDAATGRGRNDAIVRDIIAEAGAVPVQVGGGVRDEARIEALLEDGASWVVVGTRAVEDRDWLEDVAQRFPSQLVVAADVRERKVVTRGWAKTLPLDVVSFVEEIAHLPLAGVLVTAVHKEGQMQGTDLSLMEDVAEASPWPVLASGGVTTLDDLRALEHRGVAGAVLGMALYTGTIDPRHIFEVLGA
jgi:phosphoribosylformimino-5-aminoimidazole carboxamide ribotide isomerase